jgi:hypothetical protein
MQFPSTRARAIEINPARSLELHVLATSFPDNPRDADALFAPSSSISTAPPRHSGLSYWKFW